MSVEEEKTKLHYFILLFATLLLSCSQETPAEPPASPSIDSGIDRLSTEIERRPGEANLYAERAVMHDEAENYGAAIADWTAALAIDSTNVGYLYELAETQLLLQRYGDADSVLNRLTEISPKEPEAYYLLSRVAAESGDTVRAANLADRALQLDPGFTDAYLQLARLAEGKGDERALTYLDYAVRSNPTDVVALYARADYYRDRHDSARALADYRRISTIDRQETEASYRAGLLLLELDSVARAYDLFNITVKNDPAYVRAYYQRGYAAELLGNVKQAQSDYKTALRMSPDFNEASEALQRVGE